MKRNHLSLAATDVAPTAFPTTNNKPTLRAAVLSALLLVAMLWLVAPLLAQTITGSFDGVGTLTPTNTPGIFIDNFVGDGTDNTYGAFDATSMSTVDFTNPPFIVITNGVLSEVFTDGTLFGTGSGSGMANGQGMATFTIDFVITGGTGIFEHLHGDAMITGTITQTSPLTEAVDATYTGNLVTPEPSSLSLLFLGASFGYRFVIRKRWI
jgi:hypothetical protein